MPQNPQCNICGAVSRLISQRKNGIAEDPSRSGRKGPQPTVLGGLLCTASVSWLWGGNWGISPSRAAVTMRGTSLKGTGVLRHCDKSQSSGSRCGWSCPACLRDVRLLQKAAAGCCSLSGPFIRWSGKTLSQGQLTDVTLTVTFRDCRQLAAPERTGHLIRDWGGGGGSRAA